jgi:hypothetical protein
MTNKFDDLTSLTALEKQMIIKYTDDCYTDGEPERETWAWSLCETRADAAVWGSLVKKGYGWSSSWKGKDASLGLTDKGIAAYYALRPERAS